MSLDILYYYISVNALSNVIATVILYELFGDCLLLI